MTPERAARQAASLLIQAFKLVRPDEDRHVDPLAGVSILVASSGRRYLVSGDAAQAIQRAADKVQCVLGTYPPEAVYEKLQRVVIETKDSDTAIENGHEALRQQTLALVGELTTLGRWAVLHAVRGVHPEPEPFAVGHATFYRMNEQQFGRWGQRFSTGTHDPPEDAPVFRSWYDQERILLGQAVAVAMVNAADRMHAAAEGRRVIEESLNALRYGQLIRGWPKEPFPEFGLSATWMTHCVQYRSLCVRIDDFGACSTSIAGAAEGAVIGYCQAAPAWDLVQPLLLVQTPARTEMQTRVMKALSWVGQAALATAESVRLVSLTTALETMLIREHESLGKRMKLRERVPRFPQLPASSRHVEGEDIDKLYRLRSGCLHAGKTDVAGSDLRLACDAVAQCLHGLLSDSSLANASTLEEVLAILEPPTNTSGGVLHFQENCEPPGYYAGEQRLTDGTPLSVPLRDGASIGGVFRWSGVPGEPSSLLMHLQSGIETELPLPPGVLVRTRDG